MKTIVFRADASPILATGHIMRCLTLAQGLKNQFPQARIIFISNQLPENLTLRLMQASIELITLPFDVDSESWRQIDDAEATLAATLARVALATPENQKLMLSEPIDLLIVDHYLIDWQWQTRLKPYCKKLVVIDDLANRKHLADFLLDQTLNRQANDYLSLVPPSCQLLLGQKFMLLRDEFKQLIPRAKQKRILNFTVKNNTEVNKTALNSSLANVNFIKNILVNLGGLDNHNVTKTILNELIDYQKNIENSSLTVEVVMASHSPHVAQIQTLIEDYAWLTLTTDCNDMANKMLNADLAIGACGATAWERCSLGLPTLAVVLADNQEMVNKNLASQHAIINLGNYQTLDAQKITDAIALLEREPSHYMDLINNSFNSCDGLGTQRVLTRLTSPNVTLTPATAEDLNTTFTWQSNTEIRRYSRNPSPVTFDEHQQWFLSSLTMRDRHLFIIFFDQKKQGILRLDKQDCGRYEISILIAPESQGKKLALKAVHAIPSPFDYFEIDAHVHPENQASQRLFTQANFIKLAKDSYRRPAFISPSE